MEKGKIIKYSLLACVVIIAYVLGHSNAKLEPVDQSGSERSLDSLESLYQAATIRIDSMASIQYNLYEEMDSLEIELSKTNLINTNREKKYEEIRDSINALSSGELREYFTRRYPE